MLELSGYFLLNFTENKKFFSDLDIYLCIEVIIVYKIVNMDLTQNFFAILSCTYNYKLIKSKSKILQIHFFRFFMS